MSARAQAGPKTLTLNGSAVRTPAATLADLLAEQGYDTVRAMACAVNGHFVARDVWPRQVLHQGDAVEVVSPVVGG